MSVTNAISSVIVVGALLAVGVAAAPARATGRSGRARFGFIALVLACDQHLRRLPGHPAHARHVQEEGLRRCRPISPRFSTSSPASSSSWRCAACPTRPPRRQGNLYGMVGMGIAILTTLVVAPPAGIGGWAAGDPRPRHRRRHRRGGRRARADDGDAAARRRLPLAGRPRGGAGRGGRALCAAGLRHRRASARSTAARCSRWRSASPSAPSPSPARSSPS